MNSLPRPSIELPFVSIKLVYLIQKLTCGKAAATHCLKTSLTSYGSRYLIMVQVKFVQGSP